jgi:sugar/nucleoside kinase (ribokinase family)
MLDIISLGDATIDTLVEIGDATVACSVDRRNCLLQLRYGDKLPVESISQKVAGNAMNNAVGCARLGLRTAIHTILGLDRSGDTIVQALVENKVSRTFVERDRKHSTNASTVISFEGDRTILVYHAPRTYSLPKLPRSKWLYFTSLAAGHKAYNAQVRAYVERTGVRLAYNPGTYQFLEGIDEVKKIIAVTHALFVNFEEAQRIVGKKPLKECVRALYKLGAAMVFVTDGPHGATAYDGEDMYFMPILPTKVVERTGAGDAFAVGVIAALHEGKNLATALIWGASNSSSVILQQGPQDGLLHRREIETFYRKYGKGTKPEKIL